MASSRGGFALLSPDELASVTSLLNAQHNVHRSLGAHLRESADLAQLGEAAAQGVRAAIADEVV